jgi:hypothetical protein
MYGARHLKHYLQKLLEYQLARALISGTVKGKSLGPKGLDYS